MTKTSDDAVVIPKSAGEGLRRKRSSAEIREALLAAAGAEFRAHGFAGATTAAIARCAGLAEVQLFRAFPSKAALFREAVLTPLTSHFRAFQQAHDPLAVDAASFHAYGRAYISELRGFLREQAPALVSLFDAQTYSAGSGEGVAEIRAGLQAFFEECTEILVARMDLPPGRDPALLTRVAFGTLLGCITYADWLFPDADAAAIDETLTDFVLAGVGPLAGPA